MKRIQASSFKRRCFAVIKNVQTTGKPIIVTRDGKPIVKIVPIQSDADDLFGFMAGKVKIVGDIESPVTPLKHWKVMKKRSFPTRKH
jgi:prevent-host-death family protein